MSLLLRVYFPAVFGGLGGLLGWMLFGVFGDKTSSGVGQQLLGGALIGGSIGYLVVSLEAVRDLAPVRFSRLASYGVVLGTVGGMLGMWLGELVNQSLVYYLIVSRDAQAGDLGGKLVQTVSRGLGWLLLGLTVGVSEGIAARSLAKLWYGTMGGAIGGFLGGSLYGWILVSQLGGADNSRLWGGAIGLVILGACIGGFSALVQSVFEPACLHVVQGWQPGREYPLLKVDNVLGRSEEVDIPLFRDMKIEKRHAIIQRDGNRFILMNNQAPPEHTLVNDQPVPHLCNLQDGDRIQLGTMVLRFQRRVADAKTRQP